MKEHISVMLQEVLDAVENKEVKIIVDATLGLAGHSCALLKKFNHAFLYGFDQDSYAREIAKERLSQFNGRFCIIPDNFRNIANLNDLPDFNGADVILFDLGVSNMQITEAERGFSFQLDGPLDMRMDCSKGKKTAADILNIADIKELTRIFHDYGEEKFAFQIAKGIVRNRENGFNLKTTGELVALIRKILPAPVQRKMGTHPARRVFQALRIAVNDEFVALEEALEGALSVLRPNGKIIVISYHSIEDRITKHKFNLWKELGIGMSNPRKAILPSLSEVEDNYKARSAKLRVFQKDFVYKKKYCFDGN